MPKFKLADSYGKQDVPIAGLYTDKPRTPESMINVQDYSQIISENRLDYNTAVKTEISDNEFLPTGVPIFGLPSGHLVVTDQFVSGVIEGAFSPLYFAYELKFDVAGTEDSLVLSEFKGDRVKEESTVTEYATSLHWPSGGFPRYSSSLTWGREATTTPNRIRLLLPISVVEPGHSFTVSYPAYVFDTTVRQTEFINPVPIYPEGIDWYREGHYIKVKNALVNARTLYVGHRPDRRIWIERPSSTPVGKWMVSLHAGSFGIQDDWDPSGTLLHSVTTDTLGTVGNYEDGSRHTDFSDDTEYRYGAKVQTLKVRQEPARIIDANTIQVLHRPLLVDVSGVVVSEQDMLAGETEDGYPWYTPYALEDLGLGQRTRGDAEPSGITIYRGNSPIEQTDIVDWDNRNGFIKLKNPIVDNAEPIFVSYRYNPQSLPLRGIDFNPWIDNNIGPSGAVRIVMTTSGPAWHYLSEYPSGVYLEDWEKGWNFLENTVTGFGNKTVPLVSGYVIGDVSIRGISPQDIEIIDARRMGGELLPELIKEQSEYPMYLDSEEELL